MAAWSVLPRGASLRPSINRQGDQHANSFLPFDSFDGHRLGARHLATTGAGAAETLASTDPPLNGRTAFDRLQTLVGTWQGVWQPGDAETTVVFRLSGNGSVLVEDDRVGEKTTMSTVYHLDGDRLMLTHYCSAGNQPRMQATAVRGDAIVFEAFDITNRADGGGFSEALTVTFDGPDRVTLAFRGSPSGRSSGVTLERVAAGTTAGSASGQP